MTGPRFVRLAQVDGQHFITACGHGVIHLTWGRSTMRFTRDEFRRLAGMLAQAMEAPPPSSLRDGELHVTSRLDEDCELQIGPLVLLLSPTEFREFAQAAQEAVQRLDEILASGVWDRGEAEETRPNLLELLRRTSFSQN